MAAPKLFTTGIDRLCVAKTLLFFFVTGRCCLSLCGAPETNGYEFQSSLPKPGSYQWEASQRENQERQDLRRKRLSIPGADDPNAPRANTADLINGPKAETALSTAPTVESHADSLLWIFLLVVAGALLLRKLFSAPATKPNERFNPPSVAPPAEPAHPAEIRTEEKTLGEFKAAMQAGPAAKPSTSQDRCDIFFARTKKRLAQQRELLDKIGRTTSDPVLKKLLMELHADVGELKAEAGFPEVLPVWQMASAVEGLLKQLTEKIRHVTPSALRTVAGGLDLMENCCKPGLPPDLLTKQPLKFLVVDDDLFSREALALALNKAFGPPNLAENGEAALARATQQTYDVIFLDVQLPGMDGFELCKKIRDSQPNHATPIMFVTGQSDFDSEAKSILSGGNDLMGKPFLIFEVTVKALTLAFQTRLNSGEKKPAKPDALRNTAGSLATAA